MASSTIRKAIGAVKDQTSISLAKVAGNPAAPYLDVLIVKATSHVDEPADDKYGRDILTMMSSSKLYITACLFAISKRLRKTRDWIVALKSLMLLHRLLCEGDPLFGQELMFASWKGTRVLNMSDFRDEAHNTNLFEQTGFLVSFASYLDQKLEIIVYDLKKSRVLGNGNNDDDKEKGEKNKYDELGFIRVVERLNLQLQLLDRFLACRPRGAARNTRMVLVALQVLVKESFAVYSDVTDVLEHFQDCFHELKYVYCVRAFDAYVKAAKIMDGLVGFYSWCKDLELVFSTPSEFPRVQKISNEILAGLEMFLKKKKTTEKSPNETREEETKEETVQNAINEIKALPPPENFNPQPHQNQQLITENLVNLVDFDDQEGDNLALALFSTNGDAKATSAWQNPAVENGRSDWELVLVDSSSNLSKQKADLAGGFDSLMLNGMYDHGTQVRQHASNGGSASSIALPGINGAMMNNKVLALPAPDGTVKPVGQQDPFAASLSVPPPSYVQIADMERKQVLLAQEQHRWQQYSTNGMQGPMGFAKIASYYDTSMPYGYYPSY
ncbi:hypothetical protein ACP275_11G043300 [Erythranthe tilingii]